ncbi:MAG: winged helix-turn-helix domain-containing protein [Caldimonas sp.]
MNEAQKPVLARGASPRAGEAATGSDPPSSAPTDSLRFAGRYELQPVERRLLVDGQPAALGARAFDVLLALVEQPGALLGKDQLLDRVWPGLVVEENNLAAQISTLRKVLGSEAIATIPGRGYRFAARMDTRAPAIAPIVGELDLSLPDRPSIAVLPFSNLSGDPEQEYFTDGVTEDIITELSRFHSLFVIARNSTFSYKGKAVDVRTVAKELGVRYVLEGSIRRVSNRIRVTGQLIDALTGNHIWAERYDRVVEDIFAVQEEVTQSIVTAISPQIDAAELNKVRRKRPDSLGAYELAVRASAAAHESFLKTDRVLRQQAISQARDALEVDPRSILALTTIASAQCQQVIFRTAPDIDAAWQEGMDAADQAIEADPSDSRGYHRKGLLLIHSPAKKEIAPALAHLKRALKLNPNEVKNLSSIGLAEVLAGHVGEAIEHLQQALRVSPLDAMRPSIHGNLAFAHFCRKEYQEALEYALLGASEAPNWAFCHMYSAASHVGLGDIEAARSAFAVASRLAPELTKERLAGRGTLQDPAYKHRYTTFLRIAAGLEDPVVADALR